MHLAASGWRRIRLPAAALPVAALALSLGSCTSEKETPSTPSTPVPAAMEQQAHTGVNAYRASHGLSALAWNELIAEQARRHSQEMASGAAPFGHDGFDDRLAVIRQTIPWSRAAENVAVARSASSAVDGWLSSPGHRANIEGDFGLTGIGAASAPNGSTYFTQIFVKPR